MSKFSFGDFVTLAKSGWTPEAFNNALDRIENINSQPDEPAEPDEPGEPAEPNTNESTPDEANELDEKDLKIKELEGKLEKAQKLNSGQNNDTAEKKTVDDLVDDIFKDFFD